MALRFGGYVSGERTSYLGIKEGALSGGKELHAQLMALRDGLAPKLIRSALVDSVKPVLGLWRAGMREGTRAHRTYKGRLVQPGFSRKQAYISSGISRDKTKASATVGPRKEAFYNLWFLETAGFTGGRGKRRLTSVLNLTRKARRSWGRQTRTAQRIAPRPVLEPAFKASRSIMLSTLISATRKRVDKAIAQGKAR